jgi:hypothetical protein
MWHLLVTCDKVYSIQQHVTFVSDLWQGVLNTTICDISQVTNKCHILLYWVHLVTSHKQMSHVVVLSTPCHKSQTNVTCCCIEYTLSQVTNKCHMLLLTRCTQYNNMWHLLVTCDKVYSIQQHVTFVSDLWQGVLNTTTCDICLWLVTRCTQYYKSLTNVTCCCIEYTLSQVTNKCHMLLYWVHLVTSH